jgi:hypothetical protein
MEGPQLKFVHAVFMVNDTKDEEVNVFLNANLWEQKEVVPPC